MKSIKVLVVISFLIFLSCNKENPTNELHNYSWQLEKIITIDAKTFYPKMNSHYEKNSAYQLVFRNDSVFSLNTSVNIATGNYWISGGRDINILSYAEETKIGVIDEYVRTFDGILLQIVKNTKGYTIENKELTFAGNNGNIVFKQLN